MAAAPAMTSLLARTIDATIEALLSRGQRARLARHLLNRALGEGDGDPEKNGEYRLLAAIKKQWELDGTTPTIFDVGANVGDWSLEAIRGLPPSARLFAFEPTSETFESLRDRLSSAPVSIALHGFALGDAESEAPLYVDEGSERAGTNSLHRRRAEVHFNLHQTTRGSVRVRTGDNFAHEAKVDRVHLLKIDTEGHEIAVLRGFGRMLAERRVDFIQFEYGSAWADARTLLVDAFELMQPAGYQLAKLHPEGVVFFPRYDQREETFAFCNYVAVRSELARALPTLND
jgi:FkbM family methyltransferase